MRIFLIRHGETVDNVASLYAGSRDSELTNHGVQQAIRLGQFFGSTNVIFTHFFASHLRRAYKTAEYVRQGQMSSPGGQDGREQNDAPAVIKLPILMEQDFGSLEGVSWVKKPYDFTSGKQAHTEAHKDDPDFIEMESKESLCKRADDFLDQHLLPLAQKTTVTSALTPDTSSNPVVAVVSHGIMLSVLWRRLLQRLPSKSISIHSEILANGPILDLERLGGWSNTGFLELDLKRSESTSSSTNAKQGVPDFKDTATAVIEDDGVAAGAPELMASSMDLSSKDKMGGGVQSLEEPLKLLTGWLTMIRTINGRQHLVGLKRTRGGVGSAQHDDKQQKLENFFKKRRTDSNS